MQPSRSRRRWPGPPRRPGSRQPERGGRRLLNPIGGYRKTLCGCKSQTTHSSSANADFCAQCSER
eukprot:8019359-Pyramimonas_sp.AAC.1